MPRIYFKLLSCKNTSPGSDINSPYTSHGKLVGMTRRTDGSIVPMKKRQAKFARALHCDSVPLIKISATWYNGKTKLTRKETDKPNVYLEVQL